MQTQAQDAQQQLNQQLTGVQQHMQNFVQEKCENNEEFHSMDSNDDAFDAAQQQIQQKQQQQHQIQMAQWQQPQPQPTPKYVELQSVEELYQKFRFAPPPLSKFKRECEIQPGKRVAVLLACGAFSPPTDMHFGLIEDARVALEKNYGFEVMGGVFSPVHDAYQKKGLLPAHHRVNMLSLALKNWPGLACDPWEAAQEGWTRTAKVVGALALTVIIRKCE